MTRLSSWRPSPSYALLVLALLAATIEAAQAFADPPADQAKPRRPASSQDAASEAPTDPATWVDHDARPIPKPVGRERSLYGHIFREAVIEPLNQAFDIPDKILGLLGPFGVESNQQAANVNAHDEVPNSTWFTNRNHLRSISLAEIRAGAFGDIRPEKPWTITDIKRSGVIPGFQIKDAKDRRWLIKLDPPGHPQLGSGASIVSSRLVWAAGYNISHDEAVSFRREDLRLGIKEESSVTESYIDSLCQRGASGTDGRFYAAASLFLPGKPIDPIDFRGKRPDDANDWYTHKNRRELRGLYVVYAWLNNWDVKDHQSLDMFTTPDDDTLGHVTHNLLDVGASLGAAGRGAKKLRYGFEQRIDYSWMARRLVTLGFAVEPWRRAQQETGIPSVGNFESERFEPEEWRPLQLVQPFREMTERDAYWGAKLVASFSDEQIGAASDAVGYEDPRARAFLLRTLADRRDKVARYWFNRVAPLDFFHVANGALCFHDLARDIGIEEAREYEVHIEASGSGKTIERKLRVTGTEVPLAELGTGASKLSLTLSIAGLEAEPVRVELTRSNAGWIVARVRHA